MENQEVTGFGLDVGMSIPCPFCAAKGFMTYKIMEMQAVLAKEHICAECGRGSKTIFSGSTACTHMEIVQTVGDDPPEWMDIAPRRIT